MDKIAGTSIANFLPFDFQLQSDANQEDKQKGQGTNESANNTFASTEQNKTQDSSIENQKKVRATGNIKKTPAHCCQKGKMFLYGQWFG